CHRGVVHARHPGCAAFCTPHAWTPRRRARPAPGSANDGCVAATASHHGVCFHGGADLRRVHHFPNSRHLHGFQRRHDRTSTAFHLPHRRTLHAFQHEPDRSLGGSCGKTPSLHLDV